MLLPTISPTASMINASTRSAQRQPATSTSTPIPITNTPPMPPPSVMIDIANARRSWNQVAIAVRPTWPPAALEPNAITTITT